MYNESKEKHMNDKDLYSHENKNDTYLCDVGLHFLFYITRSEYIDVKLQSNTSDTVFKLFFPL